MRKFFGNIALALIILSSSNPAIFSHAPESQGIKQDSEQNGQSAVLHVNTRLVTLTITVVDKQGRAIAGLEKNDFEIYDDKVKQDVEFFSQKNGPISAALIFDTSGSMQKIADQAINALLKFIGARMENDEFCLITFNDKAKLSSDFICDIDSLEKILMGSQPEGRTAFYDAVYLGLEKIRAGSHVKKVLFIISDGQDNNSRYSLNEVKKLAKESEALIYAIGISLDDQVFWGEWKKKGDLGKVLA